MTKTSKSERKYGKKVDEVTSKPKKVKGTKEELVEDMFKILVDGSAFTRAMTHSDCIKEINKYESKAIRLRRPLPSLILVKQ